MFSEKKESSASFIIHTYGCQMNRHDSEHISGVLENNGYQRARDDDAADVVIMNTCSVRKSAEDKVWGKLSRFSGKGKKPKVVAVCGCMAQLQGAEILGKAPAVNLVFGVDAVKRLPQLIDESKDHAVCDLGDISKAAIDCLPCNRVSSISAWIPVNHGCDNRCSYCVVPAARGPVRSRNLNDIVREVEEVSKSGRLEVVLLGQNVNAYGKDLSPKIGFSKLLEAVSRVEGIRRIKFETSHPADMDESIIEVMAKKENICDYLHLPAQSGSNRTLAAMKRGYSREDYLAKIKLSRELIPEISLSTDIIVGFPGETEEDFQETVDLVEEVRFESAFVFKYSKRSGTAAAQMENEVPAEVITRRFMVLSDIQDKITEEALRTLEGKTVEVIVEGAAKKGNYYKTRARSNQVVLVSSRQDLSKGMLIEARITGTGKHTARGEFVQVLSRVK